MKTGTFKKVFMAGIAAAFMAMPAYAEDGATATLYAYYPQNEGAISQTLDSVNDVNNFMFNDKVIIRGNVTIERAMAYEKPQQWEFTEIAGGTLANGTVTLGNAVTVANGARIEIVPNFPSVTNTESTESGTENTDTVINTDMIATTASETTNTKFNRVVFYKNYHVYPTLEEAQNIYFLSQANMDDGWSLEFVKSGSGEKISTINLVHTATTDPETPDTEDSDSGTDTPAPAPDDGGGSGGCNTGSPVSLLAIIAAGALLTRKRQ